MPPAPVDGSMPAPISPACPQATRDVLCLAGAHDLAGLKALLTARAAASAQDPATGETPLHAAVRACGPAPPADGPEGDGGVEAAARAVLQELFLSGAIWNDVDAANETPGCVALRLGRRALYDMCVDAGVRAELLFSLMGGYEELSSGASDAGCQGAAADDDDQQDAPAAADDDDQQDAPAAADDDDQQDAPADGGARFVPPDAGAKPVTSGEYLGSALTWDADKLLDADLNGVMMAWETDIMRRSVAALVPAADAADGPRILNIGFGMGIVDGLFAALRPARHHIVEAHPAVLARLARPDAPFSPAWEARAPAPGAFQVHAGRWQDVVPGLVARGLVYDAIYFDTFGEDYAQLRLFFTEHVPALLAERGRFSFFNGLGADRRICYDVYTRVVEMHCADAGLDVEWDEFDVDMSALAEEGKGEWEGVRRRYWTLDKYRLPVCTFMA